MNRKPLIVGNWKMFKTVAQSVETALEIRRQVASNNHCEIVIAPVFTALKTVCDRLEGSNVQVAAQNCAPQNKEGAMTGEVAPLMLKDLGCRLVIVGHSERRQFFGDSNESVNQRTRAALEGGLSPIVCVGETLEQRESGNFTNIVGNQLNAALSGLTTSDLERIIIAYEPVWAIGTGKTASPEQAQEMHAFLRQSLSQTFGKNIAEDIRILYGGSVKPDNIKGLLENQDIDGALVGGASLDADSFAKIVNYR